MSLVNSRKLQSQVSYFKSFMMLRVNALVTIVQLLWIELRLLYLLFLLSFQPSVCLQSLGYLLIHLPPEHAAVMASENIIWESLENHH